MSGIICRNDIALFNAVYDLAEAEKNGSHYDKTKEAKVIMALQSFHAKPLDVMKKRIQAVGVSTDFAILTKDSFNITLESDNFDLGFEVAFKQVSLGKGQDAWEIYDVANSLSFSRVEEGQRIEVAGLSGTKVTANVDYYGGAIGWTDKMIRFRKVPQMVSMAEVFRNKFWSDKANNFYALLAAAAALNITAYAGIVADGQLQRDVQTINAAAFALTNRLKDKGIGNMASPMLLLYYNPIDQSRLLAAMRVTTANLAGAGSTGGDGKVSGITGTSTSGAACTSSITASLTSVSVVDCYSTFTFIAIRKETGITNAVLL